MTDRQKTDEIISLLTFLQVHIKNNVDQSFTDLTFNLESFIKDYLNIFEKPDEQYDNINLVKHNYPAIDLLNIKKDIALQITTNADLRKVRKTLKTYKDFNLKFANLIIIGFVNSTKQSLPNVTIHGIDYLIEIAKFGSSNQMDRVYEVLKRQIPWNSLSPLTDKQCFDVTFDVINRSAVRDYTICEGNFDKMVNGMSEIKEIITTGKVSGKNIRAKTLFEYTAPIRNKLSEIEFSVSSIIQICNINRNQNQTEFLCLSRQETDLTDMLKEEIIDKTNSLAQTIGLAKRIVGSRRY